MRQLALDFAPLARREALVYQKATHRQADAMERRDARRPWRESPDLLADEEAIEDARLTNPGASTRGSCEEPFA